MQKLQVKFSTVLTKNLFLISFFAAQLFAHAKPHGGQLKGLSRRLDVFLSERDVPFKVDIVSLDLELNWISDNHSLLGRYKRELMLLLPSPEDIFHLCVQQVRMLTH